MLVLSFLLSFSIFFQEISPVSSEFKAGKSIWESPELQPAMNNLATSFTAAKRKLLASRITNGLSAKAGQFPHGVAMLIDVDFVCGGSFLSSRWILTVRIIRKSLALQI